MPDGQSEFFQDLLAEHADVTSGNDTSKGLMASCSGALLENIFENLCFSSLLVDCCKPIGAGHVPYDYLICVEGDWLKVQVKKMELAGRDKPYVRNRRGGGEDKRPYVIGDYDLLYTSLGDRHWVIPFNYISHRLSVPIHDFQYLRFGFSEGHFLKAVKFARDCLFEARGEKMGLVICQAPAPDYWAR